MRGHITIEKYQTESELLRTALKQSGKAHLLAFEAAWDINA
jgi:hypothetical protein